MNEPKMKIFARVENVDANSLIDLLVNAFDTGITNYWAATAEVVLPDDFDIYKVAWLKNPEHWAKCRKVYIAPFVEGGKVTLFDNEEEGVEYVLDLEAIKRGVEVMSSKYERHWCNFRSGNDDAETADVFVQCCVLGEIVFG